MKRKTVDDLLKERGLTIEEANRLGIIPVIQECVAREAELDRIERENNVLLLELEQSTRALKKELKILNDNTERLKAMAEFQAKGRTFDA